MIARYIPCWDIDCRNIDAAFACLSLDHSKDCHGPAIPCLEQGQGMWFPCQGTCLSFCQSICQVFRRRKEIVLM